jgi:hypothetical protein
MRRLGAVALVVGATLGVFTPGVATGAVTMGQTGPPVNCQDNRPWIPVSNLARYTAPSNGVLTSWSTFGSATAGRTLELMVLQPQGGNIHSATQKDIVRPIATGVLNTYQIRLPIRQGEILGLFAPAAQPGGFASCAFGVGGAQLRTSMTLGEPALNAPLDYNDPRGGAEPNVSAVLEPDTDCDGFGDESQDQSLIRGCVAQLISAKATKKKLTLGLSCPLVTQSCSNNQVSLRTAKKVDTKRLAASAKAKRIAIGSTSVSIPAGGSLTVTTKLGKPARSLFAARSKVKAQATITSAGVTASQTLKVKRK